MRIENLQFASGVYAIRNIANGKTYIGSSRNIKKRIYSHKHMLATGTSKNRNLQDDWNVFGPKSFVAEVLVYCDPAHCVAYEQQCFDALHPQYNISPNAGGQLGWKPTKEHAAAHAERMRKLWADPEFREKVRARHWSPIPTAEHRAKIKAGLKRFWHEKGDEQRAKIRARRKSSVTRRKNGSKFRSSQSLSLWADKDYRNKVGTALEAMRRDPEVQKRRLETLSSEAHKAKLQANSNALWADPAFRAKHCKLNEQQIIAIRRAKRSGRKLKDLSAEYGVSISQISGICSGRQYAWIPLDPVN